MSDTITSSFVPRTDGEYEAAANELIAAIKQMNTQMSITQANVERLRAETKAIQAQSRAIAEDTRAKLAALEAGL